MRLYIIRHADPDYPNKTITEQGHKEAAELAKRLQWEGITDLYASPLGRAQHTAEPTAKLLDLPITTLDWTQELSQCGIKSGEQEGMMVWDLHGEIIRGQAAFPAQDDWSTRPFMDAPVYAETFARLKVESDAFLASHGYEREGGRYRIVDDNRKRIAVVCHGGFGLWWLAHLLELSLPMVWSGFWMAPSSVTTVLMDQRSETYAVPRAIRVSDVSHLYAAGYKPQPRGIKANFD